MRQATLNSAGSVALCDVGAAADSNLIHELLYGTVKYFSYNGSRDWLKIEWRDQSCMKLENMHAFDLKRLQRKFIVYFFFVIARSNRQKTCPNTNNELQV